MTSVSPPAGPSTDGRRARTERGRTAVIDAMIDLVQEGGAPLTAEAVAERAGVSISSLFRYFETLQHLQALTVDRFFERYAEAFEIPAAGGGPVAARIEGYARARVRLYGLIAPMARLARYRSAEHQELRDLLQRMRHTQVAQARTHFEVSAAVAELIATLTSFESWDQLLTDHGRSTAQITWHWISAIEALIGLEGSLETAPRSRRS